MVGQVATLTDPRLEQRLRNLAVANTRRMARARLRRRIARGETTVAQVLTDLPAEALTWPIGEVLAAQRQWGVTRARKALLRLRISETRPVGALTERQRGLLLDLGRPR